MTETATDMWTNLQMEILQGTIRNGRFPVEIRFSCKLNWILPALLLLLAQSLLDSRSKTWEKIQNFRSQGSGACQMCLCYVNQPFNW